jgi:hypothetical protein
VRGPGCSPIHFMSSDGYVWIQWENGSYSGREDDE